MPAALPLFRLWLWCST